MSWTVWSLLRRKDDRRSLRRLLVVVGVLLLAGTALGVIAAGLRIGPVAFGNLAYSRRVRVLLEVTGARGRLVNDAVNRLQPLVIARLAGAPDPSLPNLNEVVDQLQRSLENTVVLQSLANTGSLPPEVRVGLARAADLDARFSAVLEGLQVSLEQSDQNAARQHLDALQSLSPQMVSHLSTMEQLAFGALVARDSLLAERASEAVKTLSLSLAVAALLALVLGLLLHRRLFVPLSALDAGLARVAAGDYGTRLPTIPDDELGRLGAQFNRMLGMLAERHERDRRASVRLIQLLDSARDEVYVLDPENFTIRRASRPAQTHLGYPPEALSGRAYPDLVPGLTPEQFQVRVDILRRGEQLQYVYTSTHRRADGTCYPVEVMLQLFAEDDPPTLVAVVHDITERVEGELSLRESEGRFRTAFAEAPVGLLLIGLDRRIQQVNTRFAEMVGLPPEALPGRLFEEVARAEPAGSLEERLGVVLAGDADGGVSFEQSFRGPGDTEVSGLVRATLQRDDDGRPLRGIVHVEDVSAERQLERQFRQSQRIEAVGQLAGGIAHDFNNLLTAIIAYAEEVRSALDPGDPRGEDVGEILRAAQRAATLVRQLLAFARRQRTEPRVVNLVSLLHGLEPMLRRLLGADLQLTVSGPPRVWLLEIDPSLLEQVVVNLAINARDAMPGGGRLTLEVENLVAREPLSIAPDLRPGAFVCLTVRDTGVGMPPEVLAHIFEPFFTTKPVGSGSGLGLSMCYGVVKQAGGYIYAESAPGQGTTFRLYFPRTRRLPEDPPRRTSEEPAMPRGRETVLLIEDEPQVRAAARRTLELLGYTVLCAGSGTEGLELGRAHFPRLDLVVTDVVLPGLLGPQLVKLLQQGRAGLPVLFTSGHGFNHLAHGGTLGPEVDFLPKPYTPRELAARVRAALDRVGPTVAGA